MLDLIIEAQNHQILNTFKSVLVHFREGKNQARRLEDTFALPHWGLGPPPLLGRLLIQPQDGGLPGAPVGHEEGTGG